MLNDGATLKVAAAANGISRETLADWRTKDPTFYARCQSARNAALAGYQGAIHTQTNRDWKAAKYLLETAPETREDYRTDSKGGKLEIIININRDDTGVTVDGEAVEISDEEAA